MSKQLIESFEVHAKKLVGLARKISDLDDKKEGLPRSSSCELRHAAIIALNAVISVVTIILRRV